MPSPIQPTGQARSFGQDELIVSKTDTRGVLTYVNDVFLRVSHYDQSEVIGQPHSIVRHPEMPKGVFKLLWETISSGQEIFAYVNNLAADGAHYWVLAHVTPTIDHNGKIIGYHSNRRSPADAAVQVISRHYAAMRQAERGHSNSRAAAEASMDVLTTTLTQNQQTYDQFIWSIMDQHAGVPA